MMPNVASVSSGSLASVPRRQQQQQWPRGPVNDLHRIARDGLAELAMGLLAFGWFNIDQGDPGGWTPLVFATYHNHPSVVRILLDKGANLSIPTDRGFVALHVSVQEGHLAVTNMLIEGGADLEATAGGCTPLHLAVAGGHSQVVTALIQAGANVNHRALDGATPLYAAAWNDKVECIRLLLRAKADPFLTRAQPSGRRFTPLDAAAQNGHSGVARELIPHLGSDAIGGGARAGVTALRLAAQHGHVNVMAVLTDAGVVDTGSALCGAVGFGTEATVSYLLEQEQDRKEPRGGVYVNSRIDRGCDWPALFLSATNGRPCAPRLARLLVDAGADATSAVRVRDPAGSVIFNDTPLTAVTSNLVGMKFQGKDASEEQLHALEAIRRLLLQVEAARAVSWVWPNYVPAITDAGDGARRTTVASTIESPLRRMLPTLRLRATRQRLPWVVLSRYSKKL